MRRSFDAQQIGDAVRTIESRSAAEIVVEMRARSGSYAHAEGRFAALREPQRIDTDAVIDALQRLGAILTRDVPPGAVNADELSSAPEMHLA